MLREISIENLAVIEKAEAHFGGNFNVFTGETGAGKSILIGGINAILGQRTTKDIVRTGASRAVITAVFDDVPDAVNATVEEMGFDAEDELILTRIISSDGKSIARVNGRPATAAMLREIGSMLVDVHGQHENRILMSTDNQRDILDNFGGITPFLEEYRLKFRAFSRTAKQLKTMQDENRTRSLKAEHLAAVIDELEALNIGKGDGDRLEQELERCRSAAKIQKSLFGAYLALDAEDGPSAIDMLKNALSMLEGIAESEPAAAELAERLDSIVPEAEDIAMEISSLMNSDRGAGREDILSDRVSALRHAKRKYNMDSDDLVDYLDKCRGELMDLDGMDDAIERLSAQKHELAEEVKALADNITEKRKAAAQKLSDEICEQLRFLDMPNVRIVIAVNPDKVTINGRDSVEMLISANAGEEPRPINKIASGGELSRIMLAIKSVLADADDIPTLIFDEVDAGISGRAAQKVGIKLAETARKRQVLCITHLAQIAARADEHLLIEKHTEDGRTFTNVTRLDHDGRRAELARIIDGDGRSESSLAAAENMLNNV